MSLWRVLLIRPFGWIWIWATLTGKLGSKVCGQWLVSRIIQMITISWLLWIYLHKLTVFLDQQSTGNNEKNQPLLYTRRISAENKKLHRTSDKLIANVQELRDSSYEISIVFFHWMRRGGDDTLQKRCTSVDIKLIDRMGDYAIAKQFKTARS